jgi:hypothetical protein
MKFLPFLGIILLLSSCEKNVSIPPTFTQPTFSFSIDSALVGNGTKALSKDKNGYYHLLVDTNLLQTFSRVTGKVLVNGKPNPLAPTLVENVRVEWKSSHYWILNVGQQTISVYKTYFNKYQAKLQTVLLGIMLAQRSEIIPTVNPTSYPSTETGEINTIVAPIALMKGDTLTITGKAFFSYTVPKDKLFSTPKLDSIEKSIQIICD